MSKTFVIIILICLSVCLATATFSYIRYNDIVKQNNNLRNDLQEYLQGLSSSIRKLERKLTQVSQPYISDDGGYKIDKSDDILQRIKALEEMLGLVNPSNNQNINKDTQDNSIAKDNEPNSLLDKDNIRDSATAKDNELNFPRDTDTKAKYPLVIPDKKAFYKEVKNVIQDMLVKLMNQQVKERSNRITKFLERELALSLAQKENIAKILKDQQNALSKLWKQALESNFTNPDYNRVMQKANKIQKEAENKTIPYLDSVQLNKYNRLKSKGNLNLFTPMDPYLWFPR